jgi:hypothetical protein
MVKELDLFESNHGCGLNGLSSEKHSKRTEHNVTRPELTRNVFPEPFGGVEDITHGFSTFEYFDLTG